MIYYPLLVDNNIAIHQYMMEYILFLAQEANFQTRSILIPKKEFLDDPYWKQKFDMLKRNSKKVLIEYDDQEDVMIENALFQKYVKSTLSGSNNVLPIEAQGCYKKFVHEYTKTCNDLMYYAHDFIGFMREEDKKWFDKSFCEFATGFDHIQNYKYWSKINKIEGNDINITDAFLLLDSIDH